MSVTTQDKFFMIIMTILFDVAFVGVMWSTLQNNGRGVENMDFLLLLSFVLLSNYKQKEIGKGLRTVININSILFCVWATFTIVQLFL
ncbi:hypothetical protein SAMN02745116_00235 [Pilibacter termitis]|uniref:Uncharacterized protein n=1 Tax=Pilibacter termitis TaxID=263852 RepID=A0A1T4KG75_9ENTE|nr:hypothetical protein [Pilibacter termitis]SJZ41343.1 hypothetical protein SAMN02745116_00235 [Pilibacter termitis]